MSQKAEFKDFIVTVPEENQDFVYVRKTDSCLP